LQVIIEGDNYSAFELRVGLARGTISKYMRGVMPSSRTIAQISEATGCDPTWLLTGHGEPFPESRQETGSNTHSTSESSDDTIERRHSQSEDIRCEGATGKSTTENHVPEEGCLKNEGEDFVLPDSCKVVGYGGGSRLVDINISSLVVDHEDPPKDGDLVWCYIKKGEGKGRKLKRVFFNGDGETITLKDIDKRPQIREVLDQINQPDIKGGQTPPLVKRIHEVELLKVVAVWLE